MFIGFFLAALLGIIGISNLINTIASDVFSRKIELASMQSIGMTKKQLWAMLLNRKCRPVLPPLLQAIDQISLKAEKHGNDLQMRGDQNLEAWLDRKWTEEVFFNLLDNAVKYSDPHSTILVELLEYEMYVRIAVCSQGRKIEREEFPALFQRFYRGKAVKEQEGVGLGLYLAREIVKDERGYMKGEYNPVRGNIFSVFLQKDGISKAER